MRIFRVKCRTSGRSRNQRVYIGLDKLLKYGSELISRYNSYSIAVVQENINGKWVNCTDEMRIVKGGGNIAVGSELTSLKAHPKIIIHIDGDYMLLIDK